MTNDNRKLRIIFQAIFTTYPLIYFLTHISYFRVGLINGKQIGLFIGMICCLAGLIYILVRVCFKNLKKWEIILYNILNIVFVFFIYYSIYIFVTQYGSIMCERNPYNYDEELEKDLYLDYEAEYEYMGFSQMLAFLIFGIPLTISAFIRTLILCYRFAITTKQAQTQNQTQPTQTQSTSNRKFRIISQTIIFIMQIIMQSRIARIVLFNSVFPFWMHFSIVTLIALSLYILIRNYFKNIRRSEIIVYNVLNIVSCIVYMILSSNKILTINLYTSYFYETAIKAMMIIVPLSLINIIKSGDSKEVDNKIKQRMKFQFIIIGLILFFGFGLIMYNGFFDSKISLMIIKIIMLAGLVYITVRMTCHNVKKWEIVLYNVLNVILIATFMIICLFEKSVPSGMEAYIEDDFPSGSEILRCIGVIIATIVLSVLSIVKSLQKGKVVTEPKAQPAMHTQEVVNQEEVKINPTVRKQTSIVNEANYCSNCGKPIDKGAKFCKYCGKEIK